MNQDRLSLREFNAEFPLDVHARAVCRLHAQAFSRWYLQWMAWVLRG